MVKGLVFDVQRFCLHDGPGIRTTAFLKECPLRCRWCHNPEGMEARIQSGLKDGKCVRCGRCFAVCELHTLSEAGKHCVAFERCTACGKCIEVCPSRALFLSGRKIEAEELVKYTLRDRDFYGTDGGVTFSGGEPLLQAAFVKECADMLRTHGIHTAVDTCGCVPFEAFETVMPATNLFLYDLKAASCQVHEWATGTGNQKILENLRRLDRAGARIWIRIPLIHGVNDTDEEINGICDVIESLQNAERVTAIPYHDLGGSKYAELGMLSRMSTGFCLDNTRLEEIRSTLSRRLGSQRVG